MKLETLYRKAVAVGMARDPRGAEAVQRILAEEKTKADKLTDDERAAWEPDRLFNPYADTRLLAGDPAAEVRKLFVGIDMDAAELVLAHTLNRDRNAAIDLVVSHHPQGVALAQLAEVMRVQTDMLVAHGVNVAVAEQLLDKRIGEVERRVLPANHGRAVDAARLLGLPMTASTPTSRSSSRRRNRFGSRTSSISSGGSPSTGPPSAAWPGRRS